MFEGNTFFPVTGTPIRKMACMIRPLAEADPVPFAVAILKAKLLTRSIVSLAISYQRSAISACRASYQLSDISSQCLSFQQTAITRQPGLAVSYQPSALISGSGSL